ncbi:MAG TPA: GNVR domain-containing protein, partial [bacterium]|nr:GNVR domain-containing protein [bacterium]
LEAGKAIADFYGRNKVSSVDANIDVDIEIERLKEGARALDLDLDELNKRRAEIENKLKEMRVKNVPQQVYLQYLEMRREVIAKINALLSTQYEMAMIEESKEDINFQVIDDAVVPIQRYKPKRKLICVVTFMASLFLAIFATFALEYINNFKAEMRKRKV